MALSLRRRLTAPGRTAGRAWQAVTALSEPRRREVYEFVSLQGEPVTRDEVSEALGMTRSLVAFHLDKLADVGLLDVSYARPPGRPAGRGAGRPSKRYALSDLDVGLSIPPRRYDIAGRILARALASSGRRRDPVATARTVAEDEGRTMARSYLDGAPPERTAAFDRATQVLADCGYSPVVDGRCIRLRNCPFHSLVDVAPELVCTVNESFLTGVLDGLGAGRDVTAERVEQRGSDCCVEVRARRG